MIRSIAIISEYITLEAKRWYHICPTSLHMYRIGA